MYKIWLDNELVEVVFGSLKDAQKRADEIQDELNISNRITITHRK